MVNLSELEREIQKRLDAAAARRRTSQESVRIEMEVHERRTAQFAAVAQRLMHDVIRPRMHKIASLYPNAHLFEDDRSNSRQSVCSFDRNPEYPASTKLSIGLSADGARESAIITYHVEILPIFFQFEGHDQLVVPLDGIDDAAVASWLDAKLLSFTDTYLQVQVIEQYQLDNNIVDPVCGMRINRADAEAVVEYEGRRYYFCVEQCRQEFLNDPERYTTRRNK